MDRFYLLVVASAIGCLLLPTLPSSAVLCAVLMGLLSLYIASCRWGALNHIRAQYCRRILASCLLSMTVMLLYPLQLSLQLEKDATLLSQLTPQSQRIVGEVVGLPRRSAAGWQFVLKTTSPQRGSSAPVPLLIDMRWYLPMNSDYGDAKADLQLPELKEGQLWQFELQLKPIVATANPSQSWREANFWVQNVLVSAQVRYQHTTTATGSFWLPRATLLNNRVTLRQQLADGIARCCANYAAYPLWLALTIGERPFSAQMWQGVRIAGLNHILSISGMHIALVFQWCLLLGWWMRALPIPERIRAGVLWCAAATCAVLYSWLAGFAIPTQRALWSLLVLVVLSLWHRRASAWSTHLLLTCAMLCMWPALILSVSFWYTVTALTVLISLQWLQVSPQGLRGYCKALLTSQLVFSLSLVPLGLCFFQGIALWALPINLVLVPYIALVLFPATCLTALLQLIIPLCFGEQPWLAVVWQCLDWLYRPLLDLLLALDGTQGWLSMPSLTVPEIVLVSLMIVTCCWLSRQGRLVSIACVALLGWQASDVSAPRVHLIDVGQGNATLLQAGHYGALIDAGPAVGDWSATAQLLLPYLQYYRIDHLEWVLLSHDDSDHTGDVDVLKRRYPELVLYADFRQDAKSCRALPTRWRGFSLQHFWPNQPQHSDNESSCVVQVSKQGLTWLLPGDLGAAEPSLLTQYPDLSTTVLILGHHGSKSSSSVAWLRQLKPQLAITSAGRLNRFGHPSPEVIARLQLLQIPLRTTADDGALVFTEQGSEWRLQQHRSHRSPAWMEKLSQDAVSQLRNR